MAAAVPSASTARLRLLCLECSHHILRLVQTQPLAEEDPRNLHLVVVMAKNRDMYDLNMLIPEAAALLPSE